MFASINRGFMGPLGGRGDKYYEDVYGKRNDDDANGIAGDACESESDSDGGIVGKRNNQRGIDSYGKIKKRKESGPSDKDESATQSQAKVQEVNVAKCKISPSQNAKHSIEMISPTPRSVNAKLKTHKFGMFGDHGTRAQNKRERHFQHNALRQSTDLRAQSPISISDDEPASGDETSDHETNTTAPPRSVMRKDVLAAAANANKIRTSQRPRTPSMKTAYVDLSYEVAPILEDSDGGSGPIKKRKDVRTPAKRVYSRLEKRPYVLEETGKVAVQAETDGANEFARLLMEDGKKFGFVNWKREEMWLPVGTGVVVIERA